MTINFFYKIFVYKIHKVNIIVPQTYTHIKIHVFNLERLQTHLYREVIQNQTTIFKSHGDDPGPLNGLSTDTAYTTKDLLQTARYKANSAGCAYVYDYPTLFEESIKQTWIERGLNRPSDFFSCVELILDSSKTELIEVSREPAQNSIGMVAWKMRICQPEFKAPRELIVIANDSTFEQGSFGPKEDALFAAASAYARSHHIPRIYITGNNSGARIGLCKDIEKCFKVEWKEQNSSAVDYLYLTPQDYAKYGHLVQGSTNRQVCGPLGEIWCEIFWVDLVFRLQFFCTDRPALVRVSLI